MRVTVSTRGDHSDNDRVSFATEGRELYIAYGYRTISEATMPEFPTITHVALTVSDLDQSVPWYEELFDAKPLVDEDTGPFRHVVWLVGGQTLVGLHQFPDLADGSEFNERRIGLDHLAFQCANRGELEEWQARLDELGISHGGIVDAGYGSGLSFRDPDNIALEFFSPPS